MNNNIIRFLIELKNASLSRKETITVEYSRLSNNLVKTLYREGFIQSFQILGGKENTRKIVVTLRYYFNKPVFNNLKLFSKPSHLRYMKFSDICNISDKKYVCFFSTNKGILTILECKKNKIGGKLLFVC
jgi:small subunit ribosomal protein S8